MDKELFKRLAYRFWNIFKVGLVIATTYTIGAVFKQQPESWYEFGQMMSTAGLVLAYQTVISLGAAAELYIRNMPKE